MYLKEIVANGFKSFADRTRIDLRPGVTAVVGPNGCGKSNIVDAIRWVLGEQSAKSLRAGAMQDVIFAGSDRRKQLPQCEVELVFADCEKELGTAFARSWQYACRLDQVREPGQYVTLELAGEPLLVVRGNDHVLRGFFNVCRHHAAAKQLARKKSKPRWRQWRGFRQSMLVVMIRLCWHRLKPI